MNELTVVKSKRDKLRDVIIYFFVYACIGWILESIWTILSNLWLWSCFVNPIIE